MTRIFIKSGQDPKSIIPADREIIYDKSKSVIRIGDGLKAGGIAVTPTIKEWNFESEIDKSIYSDPEIPFFQDPGVYFVFYGAAKLSKNDYSFNFTNNEIILDFAPTEDGVEISIVYMGFV